MASMSTNRRARPLIRNYADLHAAVRARTAELGMTRHDLDARAGLADGHAGKLLGRRQVKRFGNTTLPLVLGALGVALVMVEDSDAIPPTEPIDASARMLAERRVKKQTAEQRSAAARKAAAARWRKQRSGPDHA
jgi:hypothetical protein